MSYYFFGYKDTKNHPYNKTEQADASLVSFFSFYQQDRTTAKVLYFRPDRSGEIDYFLF